MAGDLVLLTGATGMVGFRTLVNLLQKGYKTRVAVRNQEGFDKIAALPSVKTFQEQLECCIVPDITVDNAYSEAVKGVQYVIHVAAPLAQMHFTDWENDIFNPSVKGTVNMLEAAHREQGIKRVVITGSIASIVDHKTLIFEPDSAIHTEKDRCGKPSGPYANVFDAYMASKALAYETSLQYMNEKKPAFDLVTIAPSFIIGRDETVTEVSNIGKGTNGMLMGQLLGNPLPFPLAGQSCYLDDVAKMHAESLNPAIPGNQIYLISTETTWGDAFEIVKKHYPQQVADRKLQVEQSTATFNLKTDASFTEKTFGFKFVSFEKQVISVVDHYLEMLGQI